MLPKKKNADKAKNKKTYELIEIKQGLFRVVEIDVENSTIKLKGINKKAKKGITANTTYGV